VNRVQEHINGPGNNKNKKNVARTQQTQTWRCPRRYFSPALSASTA